jgi:hypothetical protein
MSESEKADRQTRLLEQVDSLIRRSAELWQSRQPTGASRVESGGLREVCHVPTAEAVEWDTRVRHLLSQPFLPNTFRQQYETHCKESWDSEDLRSGTAVLRALKEAIQEGSLISFQTDIQRLETLLARFHRIALRLKLRHGQRSTLEIEDEYDVQDLLRALLAISFDDIRSEEWTPSYAGKSARMDFLLKNEQIVVETKMTRTGLGEKEIGDELIIDIARYQNHPDCKILVCFVYDPVTKIGNPDGIERDLSRTEGALTVKVIVAPKP